jgi:ribonuclease P protein component
VQQVTHWRNTQYELLRLKSSTDFERVRRDGRSHAHPLVVLVARRRGAADGGPLPPPAGPDTVSQMPATPVPPTRIGFTAGRRVGTAVARNRAKRLLREAVRAEAPGLAPGWDLLLIARQPLAEASLAEARRALAALLRRAGVLRPPG